MRGQQKVYSFLEQQGISYEYYEHPAAPTIEVASQYNRGEGTTLCKNLFLRNHKGDKHYLVILSSSYELDIHDLEKRLQQGKLSFASTERMMKFLGVMPGSVSLFTLLNDKNHEVILFVDDTLKTCQKGGVMVISSERSSNTWLSSIRMALTLSLYFPGARLV